MLMPSSFEITSHLKNLKSLENFEADIYGEKRTVNLTGHAFIEKLANNCSFELLNSRSLNNKIITAINDSKMGSFWEEDLARIVDIVKPALEDLARKSI